jgi:D-serine deaminase-like pyridoxal phosphate-dependent protein
MNPRSPMGGASALSRRSFLELTGAAVGLGAATACGVSTGVTASVPPPPSQPQPGSYDPWIEILGDAFRHNTREAARLAGGRPILAVVKNNGYGLGDQAVGPLLADCREVGGIACVRVAEAIAMRDAGVTKPILVMAVASEDEIVELVQHGATPTVWGDDAAQKLDAAARRLGSPVPVELFIDTGMNREGMPYQRGDPCMGGRATATSRHPPRVTHGGALPLPGGPPGYGPSRQRPLRQLSVG